MFTWHVFFLGFESGIILASISFMGLNFWLSSVARKRIEKSNEGLKKILDGMLRPDHQDPDRPVA